MKVTERILYYALGTATVVHAFTSSSSVGQAKQSSLLVLQAANGMKMDQFSDFYDSLGYKPKTDVGHDGQTFVPQDNSQYAQNVLAEGSDAPGEDINARPDDMMAGVFTGFHASVGYTPVAHAGNDAQPVFAAVDVEAVASSATTSIPPGEIAPNGIPTAAFAHFRDSVGYRPLTVPPQAN